MSETVTASHVFLGNTATSVDEVLLFLSEKAVELGITDDVESTLEAFKNREAEGTTGMMGGFAIPHCKSDIVKQAAVMVVKFSGEVAWSSMDNAPIKCAIALLIPAAQAGDVHLQLLSHVVVQQDVQLQQLFLEQSLNAVLHTVDGIRAQAAGRLVHARQTGIDDGRGAAALADDDVLGHENLLLTDPKKFLLPQPLSARLPHGVRYALHCVSRREW